MNTDYVGLRNGFLPKNLRMIFILESPPAGHGYFYNPDGRPSEVLFRAFMKTLFGYMPSTKQEGLSKLAEEGYLLVNPLYIPVNKLPDKEADRLIMENYANLKNDLLSLMGPDRNVPLVLIKSNIFRLLEKPLLADGFNVLNEGQSIPFPLHYHINTFDERVKALLPK